MTEYLFLTSTTTTIASTIVRSIYHNLFICLWLTKLFCTLRANKTTTKMSLPSTECRTNREYSKPKLKFTLKLSNSNATTNSSPMCQLIIKCVTLCCLLSRIALFGSGVNCLLLQEPLPTPAASSVTSHTTNLNNKTIVQAYPAIIALKGSQVAIPCNISHQAHLPSPSSLLLSSSSNSSSFASSTTYSHQFASPHAPSSDSANLILWYRGDDISGSPIYTVDGRDVNFKTAWPHSNESAQQRHFVGAELTNRARVDLTIRPARLIIESIDSADSGTYWCRVDFRWTRTLISMVQLKVHVAPENVNIWAQTYSNSKPKQSVPETAKNSLMDQPNWPQSFFISNSQLSTTSKSSSSSSSSSSSFSSPNLLINANEGANLRLFCESYGGSPPPSVVWMDSSARLMDSTYHILNVTQLDEVKVFYDKFIFTQNDGQFDEQNDNAFWSNNVSLQWWQSVNANQRDHKISSANQTSVVINEMTLYRLDRKLAGANFSCLVNNTNLAPSIRRTVQIDLNLNPSHVTIMPPTGSYLSDGLKTEVNCRAHGGKPYSLISWFLDNQNITHLSDFDYEVNYTTSSVLKFTPKWRHDQGRLICLAYNPTILTNNVNETFHELLLQQQQQQKLSKYQKNEAKQSSIRGSKFFAIDSLVLDIKYVPQIKLIRRIMTFGVNNENQQIPESSYFLPNYAEFNEVSAGDSNNMAYVRVEEGGNVTLDCIIIAKPVVTVVRWTHNLAEIWHETEGIVAENQSLSIINAKRGKHEGIYRCVAFNSEGRGVSNEIRIAIDYAPQCQMNPASASGLTSSLPSQIDPTGRSIYYAKIGQTVNITCDLDARPSHNVTFYWTLNNQISERLQILTGNGRLGGGGDQVSSSGQRAVSAGRQQESKWESGSSQYAINPLQSVASIVPRTSADFGIVRCWARNPIGYQATPCMFFLNQLASSPPSPFDTSRDRTAAESGMSPATGNSIDSPHRALNNATTQWSNSANLPASSQTSLIGTSSQSQSLSPSSYSSMLSRTNSNGAAAAAANNHVDMATNSNTNGNNNNNNNANRNKQIHSSESRLLFGNSQHQQQHHQQQHRLLNHLCQLNRTLNSVALNCSLIESSSLSAEIFALWKNSTSFSSSVDDDGDSGAGMESNLIWSETGPTATAPPSASLVIVTYLIELYDNQDNLLSGKFITATLEPTAPKDGSSSTLANKPNSNVASDAASSISPIGNLLYEASNLTSNTWYKLRLKTFVPKQKRRKRSILSRKEMMTTMTTTRSSWTTTILESKENFQPIKKSRNSASVENKLRQQQKQQQQQQQSVTVVGALFANDDNDYNDADNGNYSVPIGATDQMMNPSNVVAVAVHDRQIATNGAHSAPTTGHTLKSDHQHEATPTTAPAAAIATLHPRQYISNGTFQNVRIDPLLWPVSLTSANPMDIDRINGGHRQGLARRRRSNYDNIIRNDVDDGQYDAEDDYYDDEATDMADSDANETEMDLVSSKSGATTAGGDLSHLDGSLQHAQIFPDDSNIPEERTRKSIIVITGVMNPYQRRQFRDKQKELKRRWKLFASELVRFRTLSSGPTYIGFHNDDDYFDGENVYINGLEYNRNGNVNPNGDLDKSEIVPKSLTDQTIFRPMFILLSIGSWLLLAVVLLAFFGFVFFKLKSSMSRSSSSTSSTTEAPHSINSSTKSLDLKDLTGMDNSLVAVASGNQLMENIIIRPNYNNNTLEESSILYESHNGSKLQLFPDHEQAKLVSQNYNREFLLSDLAGEPMLEMEMIGQSTVGGGAGFTILRSSNANQLMTVSSSSSPNHQQRMLSQLMLEQSAAMAARQHNNSSNNSSYSTMTTSSSILGSGPGSSAGGSSGTVASGSSLPNASKVIRYAGHDHQQLADIVELTSTESTTTVPTSATNHQLMLNLMMMRTNHESNNDPINQVIDQRHQLFQPSNTIQIYEPSMDQSNGVEYETMLLMNQQALGGHMFVPSRSMNSGNVHVKLCEPNMAETNVDNTNYAVLNFVQQDVPNGNTIDHSTVKDHIPVSSKDDSLEQVITSYSTCV